MADRAVPLRVCEAGFSGGEKLHCKKGSEIGLCDLRLHASNMAICMLGPGKLVATYSVQDSRSLRIRGSMVKLQCEREGLETPWRQMVQIYIQKSLKCGGLVSVGHVNCPNVTSLKQWSLHDTAKLILLSFLLSKSPAC